jgi:hypothetical protein
LVDLASVVGKGKVFAAMQNPNFFVERMRVADDRLGLEWPDRVDFSADGLRFMAFPEEAEEFGGSADESIAPTASDHTH